ncbi:MAG TPA: hypothetical protein VIW45_21615 [Vicinamibacterales bacterium]
MSRHRIMSIVVIAMVIASTRAIYADVKADEKTHVELAGMLGRMVNLFGGKAAREGVTSTVAVKGNRKATMNETSQTGQIIDLSEEKIYDLDLKKKNYKVTTFAELRKRMEEAQERARKSAEREEKTSKPSEPAENNVEVDFSVKNTGEKKAINGFETHEAVATVTIREKGKTLEQGGGMVLTADMWLAPRIAAMKEIADFDMRYAQKLYGPMLSGVSAEQMATAMAMYPMMKQAIGRMNTEGAKLDGTPILTTTTIDSVKSQEQMASESKQSDSSASSDSKPSGVGGLLGGLAKKARGKGGDSSDENKARATFMTSTSEVLKVVTSVTADDVAIPAGFKENK